MFFGAFIFIYLFILLFAVGVLIGYIFYLITVSSTLDLCLPHNRKMNPGQVWLVLIPLFGIYWHFVVVAHLADSIAWEMRSRNLVPEEERPAYNVGLWSLILRCAGFIPFLGILASLAGLVLWIIHWSKVSRYKKILAGSQPNFSAPFMYQQPYGNYGGQGPYQQP